MRKHGTFVIVVLVAVLGASLGRAQKSTEMFIPIGKSPGLSGKHTSIGKVAAVDAGADAITLRVDRDTRVIHCSSDTKFWVDRSKLRLPNQVGSLADCRVGRRIEVKYVGNNESGAVAEWVKIEVVSGE